MTYPIISRIQFACSRTIVSCIGTFILCKTVLLLQEDLDTLALWEADSQMKFNVAKCHSMRMIRHYSHKQILHDFTLHQQTLENVQSAKYLGITIMENMDWDQHISDISSKVTKTLGCLLRNLAFASRSTKEVAFKTLVCPILEYAAPICSPYCNTQIKQVENVQRRQPAGPAGGDATLIVLVRCSMSCNGQL